MDMVLRRSVRNSELAIAKEKRAFLTYPAEGLAPCTLEETEDGISFVFETAELEAFERIVDKPREEQLRFLINCASLKELYVEYDFPLSPDNLLIDLNLLPRALTRDTIREGGADFLPRYKALIGSVLQRRYKYDDYLNGGKDLYKKNKLLSKISAFETADEIKAFLLKEYQHEVRKTRETKKLVPKRQVWFSLVAIPLLCAALITAAFFEWKTLFQDIPYKDSVIAANTAYIAGDYIEVQHSLESFGLNALTYQTKYFLSRSYVITEALTDEQKDNVLTGLTLKTDAVLFDYWILLGRLDFTGAIDIAQRLSDDELLLFAYMKNEVFVKNDSTLSGEEKVSMISDFESKISDLKKARDDAVKEVQEAEEAKKAEEAKTVEETQEDEQGSVDTDEAQDETEAEEASESPQV